MKWTFISCHINRSMEDVGATLGGRIGVPLSHIHEPWMGLETFPLEQLVTCYKTRRIQEVSDLGDWTVGP